MGLRVCTDFCLEPEIRQECIDFPSQIKQQVVFYRWAKPQAVLLASRAVGWTLQLSLCSDYIPDRLYSAMSGAINLFYYLGTVGEAGLTLVMLFVLTQADLCGPGSLNEHNYWLCLLLSWLQCLWLMSFLGQRGLRVTVGMFQLSCLRVLCRCQSRQLSGFFQGFWFRLAQGGYPQPWP